jgi:hypothetical protein
MSEATHIHVSDDAFSLLTFPILHLSLHGPISSEDAGEHPAVHTCGGWWALWAHAWRVGRPASASAAGERSCLQLLGCGRGTTSCCYAGRRPASSATCCSHAGATSESGNLQLLTRGATCAAYCCFSYSHMMVLAGEMLPPAPHAHGAASVACCCSGCERRNRRNACRAASRGQLLLWRVTSATSDGTRRDDNSNAYKGPERSIPSRKSTRLRRWS